MPKATLICHKCGHTARRDLIKAAGCRGHRETPTKRAICPQCRIEMDRSETHLRASAYNLESDYNLEIN